MPVRLALGVALALALLLAAAGSAGAAASGAASSARAFGIRVILPGKAAVGAGSISSPPQAAASLGGWSHGSGAAATGPIAAGTRAVTDDGRGVAQAVVTVRSISLLGGEITVALAQARASATASGSRATGRLANSSLSGVTVLGEAVTPSVNARVPLGDWGYVVLLEQAVVREEAARFGYRGFVTAVHVHLTADHAGLPAGTQILVGYAEAAASAPKGAAAPPPPPPVTRPAPVPPSRDPVPPPPGARPAPPPPVVQTPPPGVRPKLTERGYVFPVYGPASFSDDFRAGRASVGWHHGNDIFAPLGAPVLAVADGELFLVGWNGIGGNRLWLRDREGNEFYYAHLSAFSPLARNGAQVRAGDVVGFVGATGDAVGTPYHLHFEIHPRSLLWMGYDGVVNPYPYLLAWRRLADVAFSVSGWTPPPGKAPPAGALLLEAEDIASVSGLAAEGLSSVLAMPPLFGEGLPGPKIVEAPAGFGEAP